MAALARRITRIRRSIVGSIQSWWWWTFGYPFRHWWPTLTGIRTEVDGYGIPRLTGDAAPWLEKVSPQWRRHHDLWGGAWRIRLPAKPSVGDVLSLHLPDGLVTFVKVTEVHLNDRGVVWVSVETETEGESWA